MVKLIVIFSIFISTALQAQQPVMKGGFDAFLKDNIIYPPYAKHNCIQGTINIGFKLNEKGVVSQAVINQGIGAGLDEEALRLIRLTSGKWIMPAAHDTTALFVVPVNFALSGYGCETKTKAEIAMAINAYKNEDELFNVVKNYYRNKENGTLKNDDSEAKIVALKKELGVDDEYLDERINTALKKYNQGDHKGACEDFIFVKYMGSTKADEWIAKYCK